MDARRVVAILVLLAGLVLSNVGIRQVSRAKTPNPCILSFAKSLGGPASFNLKETLQQDKRSGLISLTSGAVLVCAGLVILFYPEK